MKTALLFLALAAVAAAASPFQPQQDNAQICKICEDVVGAAEKEGGNDVKGFLEKEIATECGKTGLLKKVCEKAFDEIVDDLVKLILAKETPEVACKQVHLC
ncbi:unnamed protein product, partial [Mesorhabditis spiculigera]